MIRATYKALIKRYEIIAFYCAAIILYFAVFGPQFLVATGFPQLTLETLIAPIMALGSFVAGATFLGGGAVAFPALTKILHADPITAKTFSLAIQSVGMTSAALYIFYRVRELPLLFILVYLPGSCLGVCLSMFLLEDGIASIDLRIGFTLFVFCFLCVYLWTRITQKNNHNMHITEDSFDHILVFVCGIMGGGISGLIGSGADLVAFCLLALYFRLNLRLATQTSVVVMAVTSIIGITFKAYALQELEPEVFELWLIAAPVVLIGAPVGAIFCRRIKQSHLLVFIIFIVLCEVISTAVLLPVVQAKLPYYILLVVISLLLMLGLQKASPYHEEKKYGSKPYKKARSARIKPPRPG